jgi:hypothetical protein
MQTKITYLATISTTALIGLGLASGCHHDSNNINARGQDFAPPGATSALERINDAQAIKGAAADAMLEDQHFDGILLNSLGRKKLDLMMRGTSVNKPLVVYLDMSHDTAQNRQAAVTDYIKNAGVDDSAIQVVIGPNPHMMTPTAYNLNEVYKGDGTTITGEAADENVAAAAAAAAPAGK